MNWTALLSKGVQVCPVQLPGRETLRNEPLLARLAPLVEKLTNELEPYLLPPFAFFGHSLGALVAFELARAIRRRGASPVHLFVSSFRAPQLPRRGPCIHALPEAEFIRAIQLQYGGIPRVILDEPELLEIYLPILKADLEITETYDYAVEPPIAHPLSVFGGNEDANVTRHELEQWNVQSTGSFTLRMFPGDHFYLNGQARTLAGSMMEDLKSYLEH